MDRKILDPYWGDDARTQIICKFEYEDGRILDVSIVNTEDGNPDWDEVMKQFGKEHIDESTDKRLEDRNKRIKEQQDNDKERHERAINEELFNFKINLYNIPEVSESSNRALKSKIRKAKTKEEALVYASVLVQKEIDLKESVETIAVPKGVEVSKEASDE